MGLMVLGALSAAGVCKRVWLRLRLLSLTAVAVFVGMLSAHAAPPEKPNPKGLPMAEDTRKTPPLTQMMEDADKDRLPQETKQEETPKERYIRQVTGLVEKKWHIYIKLRRDGVTTGSLQLVFYVNKKGKVESLRILDDKKSNKVLTEITLQAIKDAEIPPIPADVIPWLPKNEPERLQIHYDALIY